MAVYLDPTRPGPSLDNLALPSRRGRRHLKPGIVRDLLATCSALVGVGETAAGSGQSAGR